MQVQFSRFFIVLLGILLVVSLYSCKDCTMETQDIQTVRLAFFKKAAGGKPKTVIDTAFTKVYGFDFETQLYPLEGETETTKKSVFQLPLDTSTEQTAYIFQRGTSRDTIVFTYTKYFRVYTPDCGYTAQINDFTVLYTTFPEHQITSPTLSSLNKYDIEIYP